MSLLQSVLHSLTPPVQLNNAGQPTPPPQLRKASSHASFLNPLVRLVRDPTGSIEGILGTVWASEDEEEKRQKEELDQRKHVLYQNLCDAEDYEAWRRAATELDALEGNDTWKNDPESPLYDHAIVKARLDQLNEARLSRDPAKMLFLLRTSLTRLLGNMGDLQLYKHSHIGTKVLIEDYIAAACSTLEEMLECLETHPNTSLEHRTVLEQLIYARQAFGRSALLLSGGGTFGMNHIGVVKCLWESGLLPRIVCGSSAGSIVASVLGTRTDLELPATLEDFCIGEMDVFEKEGEQEGWLRKAARFAKYGSVFDIQHLIRIMKNLLGNMTFQEAYNRTRRITNISVSSAGLHELPRLLNYITAPNVIIWSAVAASCSVPLVFSPASILAKDPKNGDEVPWDPSPQRWIDGSVDSDLPMTRLAEMFNVNHFIVSQVNPHVVPFLPNDDFVSAESEYSRNPAVEVGPSWLHSMANFAKSEALHRMHVLAELGVFPVYFTKLRSVLSQKYSGDITILPAISYAQFPRVLMNPDTDFMLNAMLAGERATWPKLSRVKNHCAIELALDNAVQKLRAHIAFSPSQVDLRIKSLSSVRKRASATPLASGGAQRNADRNSWSSEPKQRIDIKNRLKFDLRPGRKLRQKLNAVVKVQPPSSDSDSGSNSEADDDAYFQLKVPRKTRSRPEKRPAAESESDSSFSNPRSYSPSSEPGSPDLIPTPTPSLWPSTRQLFPFRSQPSTPYFPGVAQSPGKTPPVRRDSQLGKDAPGLDLSMTKLNKATPMTALAARPPTPGAEMSEPEKKYKRLFHRNVRNAEAAKPLVVDVSGTRGMMLRRKKSRSLG